MSEPSSLPVQIIHGGDLAAARLLNPSFNGEWLDLSTGINPYPYPRPELNEDLWMGLPPKQLETDLLAAAYAYYQVRPAARVVAAPGTQILISLLPRLIAPTEVAILSPTYGEYKPAWVAAGHTVREISSLNEIASAKIVVLANPNNPDGRILDPECLNTLRQQLVKRGGLLVVDEAFTDVTPEISLADKVAEGGLVVFRSFGKFFGLAGLRLGFALCEENWAKALQGTLGPWAISGIAAQIGCKALTDKNWSHLTRLNLIAEMKDLHDILLAVGLRIVGGTPLFVLTESDAASDVFSRLIAAGIYVRRFEHNSRWLRFGFCKEQGRNRLSECLLR